MDKNSYFLGSLQGLHLLRYHVIPATIKINSKMAHIENVWG